MADNKQYITQVQENGTIHISEDVLYTIVTEAAAEVEGVRGLSTKLGADIADLAGVNWGKGVKIAVADDNSLTIICNITVAYGQTVVTVAQAVQDSVIAAVENMTGLKVAAVDVNVCGIVQ